MKILRETKDMTTEEFAQYKSDRTQASKAASKAREKGNVTKAKAEETESGPEAEEKAALRRFGRRVVRQQVCLKIV